MNTMGTSRPSAVRRSWSSNPLSPGRWTSRMRQSGAGCWGDCRNSSAVANVATFRPTDRIKRRRARRTDSSSSMMKIVCWVGDTLSPGDGGILGRKSGHRSLTIIATRQQGDISLWSNKSLPYAGMLKNGGSSWEGVQRPGRRLRRRDSYFLRKADQFRHRVGPHLAHDLRAVDLDGFLRYPEPVAYLLVEHAAHDECHHLALARAEGGGTLSDLGQLSFCLPGLRMPGDCL